MERVPWEAILRGKGVHEGWTFFKKEILRHRSRLSSYAETQVGGEEDWPGLKKRFGQNSREKKVYSLWKKWQATQEDCKGVVKSWRKKIRSAKGQVEVSLAIGVIENKNVFMDT